MAAEQVPRRLAAIMAADVVGYSRVMEADEEGTLASLKKLRQEGFDPKVAEHHGRIVKTTGDGALVEFASAVDALRCAVALQRSFGGPSDEEPGEPGSHPLRLRIGINIGDVIIDGDDIYGNGVNVAARLEALAEPGGICISGRVLDQVEKNVDVGFAFLGPQTVKNIDRPVNAYRVLLDAQDAGKLLGAPTRMRAGSRLGRLWLAAASLALIGVAGALFWGYQARPTIEPASVERMAHPLPDKPSIAVLPFANLSADTSQDYFADGMTEDLITDLSKISGLFVIARNSTFIYKGRSVEIRQVAEDLGVRYVLEGSVRRADDRVRINAQLIDAMTGGHLWAERYDGTLGDVFALQDDVTQKIVAALAVSLTGKEEARQRARYTNSAEAYDAFLKGWELYQHYSADAFVAAIPHFERAVELDPDYGHAHAALASLYWKSFRQGEPWAMKVNPDPNNWVSVTVTRDKVEQHLKLAMRNPSPLAHQVASALHWQYRQFEEAVSEAERAVALNPNDPDGHVAVAWAEVFYGRPEKALEAIDRARRLDPLRPDRDALVFGMAHISLGNYAEAADALASLHERSPEYRDVNVPLAVASAYLGDLNGAKAAVERYVQASISFQTNIADIMGWWPFRREADFRHFAGGLIKAGLGDEDELDQRIHILRLGGTLQ